MEDQLSAGPPLLVASFGWTLNHVSGWNIVGPVEGGVAVIFLSARRIGIRLLEEKVLVDRVGDGVQTFLLLGEPMPALGVRGLHSR